ncbi:hypothetical protein A1O1_06074 [Capronia coronata CBS 617.96]|uniref:DNA replication factor Cdt1 C-terminal domain-containing protein n=1 Tax=Capronia coronata CBS 617.96 TaxID=1182541 RepID=W9Y8Y3_9EURO|nr:uncharacterized protein A1O1_06074 [Capronia coronata CBS 617.96]EXJ85706.1 hypothetical protein A1O1_06074 [Capronia coronata CBS 617.96]
MAPSVHGTASRVGKRQAGLQSYAKVSKNINSRLNVKALLKEAALNPVVNGQTSAKATSKRKHIRVQDDSDAEKDCANTATSKKPKLQLPTPPPSRKTRNGSADPELSPSLELRQLSLDSSSSAQSTRSSSLPRALKDLISLHGAFLRAFMLHIAHNGRTAPADLGTLMASMTRLWKKQTVQKEDIQRILAMYELDSVNDIVAGQLLKHKNGPFKLTITLAGGESTRHSVEYVGTRGLDTLLDSPFDERSLQNSYEAQVQAAFESCCDQADELLRGEVRQLPRLEFTIGSQTQARKSKATAARKEILRLSSQAQNRSGSQFSAAKETSQTEETTTPQVVKDRTLSLLDRVRAKALASSTTTPNTPEAIVRRYALGRIQEVVEILRMLQQRKLASNFNSSIHSSPGKVRGKVSFSLNQLVNDIRGSLAVPLGEAEIRMCIKILADDVPGIWLSVYTVGNVQSVVLNGPGMSGIEVKKILDGR